MSRDADTLAPLHPALQYARAKALSEARMSPTFQNTEEVFRDTTHAIEEANRGGISTILSPAKLALKHRKKIREGDFSVFLAPFAFALSKDGILDLVPILGKFIGIFITVYLFIFLFGKGTWKWKIIRSFGLLFDALVPFLSLLPITTFCVWVTYRQAKQDAEKAKKELNEIETSFYA